jgi:glucose-1-phosphate cytidylyltransferase
MKVVIFAGGYGTRLSEETSVRPKPMVEVGPKPILWHIMKIYAHYGYKDFVVLGGYKVEAIRRYFLDYARLESDFTVNLRTGAVEVLNGVRDDWRVSILDTGLETMTGGRLKRAQKFIGEETFFLTYGDGVSDINVEQLLTHHRRSGATATVTAVNPPGRFGVLGLSEGEDRVQGFREKDQQDVGLINGGFFVCDPGVFQVIDDDATVWEQKPLRELVHRRQLSAYRHLGFWQPMDTLRDKAVLDGLWEAGKAPWKVWSD